MLQNSFILIHCCIIHFPPSDVPTIQILQNPSGLRTCGSECEPDVRGDGRPLPAGGLVATERHSAAGTKVHHSTCYRLHVRRIHLPLRPVQEGDTQRRGTSKFKVRIKLVLFENREMFNESPIISLTKSNRIFYNVF